MTEPKILPLKQRDVDGAKLYATRFDMIADLGNARHGMVAEVGVAFARMSRHIAEFLKPRRLYAIDLFNIHEVKEFWRKPGAAWCNGKTHLEHYLDLMGEFDDVDVVICQGDSSKQLKKIPKKSLDLIYIDAAHTFEAVSKDARASLRALKSDGVLVFNDYIIENYTVHQRFGVIPVVNDLVVRAGFKVIAFALAPDMYCDIAIRRREYC